MKRRILEEIKIDEISGVDKPAQQHALVTIMKRAPEGIEDTPNKQKEPPMQFDQTVETIRKRDNCSRTEALRKARFEAPDSFAAYRDSASNGSELSYAELVQAELDSGAPYAVAGQRVLQKFGVRPNAPLIQKAQDATAGFMAKVSTVMADTSCSRTAAMREVRKRHPDLYNAFQDS